MRTKIFAVLLAITIAVLNINIVLADNGFLCADDFENYGTEVLGGGWTVRPGNMNLSAPVVSTEKGKSAKIVSDNNSRIELINFFPATGDSVEAVDFKFSARFDDRNATRSLYIRKSPSAEVRLLTFSKDSEQISLWSRTVPGEVFAYKLNTWYEFHIRYNVKEGFLRIEISDGVNKTVLQERERSISAIEGVSFVSFGTGDEDTAVSYVDDVKVSVSEAVAYFPDGIYLNDNFENNFEKGTIAGYDLWTDGDNTATPFDWEYTDLGKSGVLSPDGNSIKLSKNIEYLQNEKAVSFGLKVKAQKGKLGIEIGNNKVIEIDFNADKLLFGGSEEDISLSESWNDIAACYYAESSLFKVTVENKNGKETFSDNIGQLRDFGKFSLEATGEDKIYIDNIFLYPSALVIAKKEAETIAKPDIENSNLFADNFTSFTEGTPAGWAVVSGGCTFSPSDGGVKLENAGYTTELQHGISYGGKNVECVEYNIRLKICDNNSNKALFMRDNAAGDKSFLTFKTDSTVSIGSVSIPSYEFTYELGKIYDISLSLNLENGYIRATFFDGENLKTLQGERIESYAGINRISFVSFSATSATKAIIYSVSVNAVDPIYPLRMDYSSFGCEDFSPYWGGSDLKGWSFVRDTGCKMSASEGRYGTNVKITTVDGGSCKIYKTYDNTEIGENFLLKFTAFFPDNVSERQLALNGINILSFLKNGEVKLGETNISSNTFSYKTNTWYNFEIYGNRQSGELCAKVLSDTFSLTFSGNMPENVSVAQQVSFSGSGEGAVHFDNFAFVPAGLCDILGYENEKCVNPSIDKITLLFTDNIVSGNAFINGKKIENIAFDGRKVHLSVFKLEKLTEYAVSFTDLQTESGKSFCGNFRFKTGAGIEILSSGFKKYQSEDTRLESGGMVAYVNFKNPDAARNVMFAVSIYDKNSSKLLFVKTKRSVADKNIRSAEIYFEVPQKFDNLKFKLFMWDCTSVPLAIADTPDAFLRPDGESVLSLLRERYDEGEHPRILADKNDFARVRNLINTDPRVKRWYMEIRAIADNYLYQDPIEYVKPGTTLEAPTYVREVIFTLGFMYQITGDIRYAERVYEEMANAAAYPDWNPYHYLDTATMMNAFAVGYDLIYDYIVADASRKETVLTAVKNYGFETVLEDYQNTGGRERSYSWTVSSLPDNWNIICNSGAMIAALSFADELPEYTEKIFTYGLEHIEKALKYFAPDGAWFEGAGYWGYFMRYLSNLLVAMNTSLGTDFGLSQCEGFEKTAYFPFAMTGGGGVFNFHNCGAGFTIGSEMYILSKVLGDKNIAALYTKMLDAGKASAGVLGMLYYDSEAADSESTLPLDFCYANTEVCSMRSGNESDATFVALHAGQNNVSHGHLDIGEFVIDMLGERFACALGAENYSVTTDIPWGLYRKRAEGHNTLVINPDINPDQIPSAKAIIDRFESCEGEALAVINMTSAYKEKVKNALRGVKLCEERNAVIIRDEVFGRADMDLWWFMHTAAEIELSADNKTAYLTSNGKKVKAEIIDGGEQTFSVRDALPMDERLNVSGQNANTGIKKLCINVSGKTDVVITVAVTPLEYTLKDSIKPINEW